MSRLVLSTTLFALCAVSAVAQDDPGPVREGPALLDPRTCRVGELIENFPFTDLDGKTGHLSDLTGRKAVVIVLRSVGCPVGKKYAPRLEALRAEYSKKGVRFLFVNPMEQDTVEDMLGAVERYGFGARYVPDTDQKIARTLGARATTDVFVLDRARTLVYRGAVDDQYGLGYAQKAPHKTYLRAALDAILEGREPEVGATSAPGCVLRLSGEPAKKTEVTYHNRISRIVQRNCVECHRKGENGPFELTTYKDVRGSAGMIEQMVERRLMPPWFAAAHEPGFSNDRSLSDRDREDLLAWIRADCPKGDRGDAPLPRSWAKGWKIGKPDLVVQLPQAFRVPAEGVVEYQYVDVPTGLKEDRWVQAFEVRPTAPEVVHHILVFVLFPRKHARAREQPRYRGGLTGYFAAMVPGQGHLRWPDGMARFLPKGAVLRFQIHYTPNGEKVKDRARVGLIFAKEAPRYEVRTHGVFNNRFLIKINARTNRKCFLTGSSVSSSRINKLISTSLSTSSFFFSSFLGTLDFQ